MEAQGGGGVSDEEIAFELKNSESAWDEVRRLLQTLNEAAPLGFGRDSTCKFPPNLQRFMRLLKSLCDTMARGIFKREEVQ